MAELLLICVLVDVATRLFDPQELRVTLSTKAVGSVVNIRINPCIGYLLGQEVDNQARERDQAHVLDSRDLLGRYLLRQSHLCKFKLIIIYWLP